MALQLMDTSSLGMASKYTSFKETHRDLQYALQAIVNGTMVVFCFPSGLSNLQQITPPRNLLRSSYRPAFWRLVLSLP